MACRYECELSPETFKKAVDELNEPLDNEKRLAEIDRLRTRFEEEFKHLDLIRTDDSFILRFLRVKKFDQDRALSTLVNYHTHRKEWRELFDLVDNPKDLEDLLDLGTLMPIPGRAVDGTFVLYAKPGLGFKDATDPLKFCALAVITLEKMLEDEEFQIYGMSAVEDLSNMSLSVMMQMVGIEKKILNLLQDGLPIRVKSLNMVNEGLIFDAIYAIMSIFMKEKMKNRLHVHGTDYKKLCKSIGANILPPYLGGTAPELDPASWKKEILSTVGGGESTSL